MNKQELIEELEAFVYKRINELGRQLENLKISYNKSDYDVNKLIEINCIEKVKAKREAYIEIQEKLNLMGLEE